MKMHAKPVGPVTITVRRKPFIQSNFAAEGIIRNRLIPFRKNCLCERDYVFFAEHNGSSLIRVKKMTKMS